MPLGRRKRPRTARASASLLGGSSLYRRFQHNFVSGPEILLGRHEPLRGLKPPFPASGQRLLGSPPKTSSRNRPSVRSPISPRPWSSRGPPCRAAPKTLLLPGRCSLPCAHRRRWRGCHRRPEPCPRRTHPRFASQNPPAAG